MLKTPNDGFESLLNYTSEVKNVSQEDLELLMRAIMDKETGGDVRPDKTQGDSPTGFGRGVFQFENRLEKGKTGNTSSKVALNRLKNLYKKKEAVLPEWAQELPDDYDPIDLTIPQQKMLFLAYHLEDPRSNFSELNEGMSMSEWWGKYHQTESNPEAMKDFDLRLNKIKQKDNELSKALNQIKDESYVLERGDTLYSLAKKFNTTPLKLMQMNNIKDPSKLKVGQKLKVK